MQTLGDDGAISVDVDAGDLTVSGLVTAHSAGNVTLNADAGTLTQDVGQNISSTSGHIELAADAVAQSGNILTGEAGTLTVTADNGAIAMTDGTHATTQTGDITYMATGDVALSLLTSESGSISVTAGAVTQNGNILTGGDGAITVTADNGDITMADGTSATTQTGAIDYTATGDVALSLLTSLRGTINVTAGSGDSVLGAITDTTDLEAANLVSTGLVTLTAETGIGGADAADIDTTILILQAGNRTRGSIIIQETDGLVITGTGMQTLGGDGAIAVDVAAGDLTIGGSVTSHGAGSVTLNADAGTLTQATGKGIGSTSGSIELTAEAVAQNGNLLTGEAGTLTVTADKGAITMVDGMGVRAQAGVITYTAASDITIGAVSTLAGDVHIMAAESISQIADITTSGGNLRLSAQNGSITMADGTRANTAGQGSVTYEAVEDIALSIIDSASDVTIITTGGSISDVLSGETANITGSDLTLKAVSGIGSDDDIDTKALLLDALNSGAVGDIWINQVDGGGPLSVNRLAQSDSNGDGDIHLVSEDGTVVVLSSGDGVVITGSGDVTLLAMGSASDLVIDTSISSVSGRIVLGGGRNVDVNEGIEAVDGAHIEMDAGRKILYDSELSFDGEMVTHVLPEFTWSRVASAGGYYVTMERDGVMYDSTWVYNAESWAPGYDLPAGQFKVMAHALADDGTVPGELISTLRINEPSHTLRSVQRLEENLSLLYSERPLEVSLVANGMMIESPAQVLGEYPSSMGDGLLYGEHLISDPVALVGPGSLGGETSSNDTLVDRDLADHERKRVDRRFFSEETTHGRSSRFLAVAPSSNDGAAHAGGYAEKRAFRFFSDEVKPSEPEVREFVSVDEFYVAIFDWFDVSFGSLPEETRQALEQLFKTHKNPGELQVLSQKILMGED